MAAAVFKMRLFLFIQLAHMGNQAVDLIRAQASLEADSSCAVKKMTRLLSPFGLTNNKEDTADRFQDAIHALYENADREKALHMLSVYFAVHLDTMSG